MATKRQGLKKGDVLKNRYEILSLIGEGGMSRVFLASDRQLTNKQWAIKEVDRRATDPMGRPIEQTLTSEAEILSRIDHPNIVDIVDIEKTDNFVYVVMDHVPGQTLAELVRKEGPQSEEDVQKWMLQICDALGYLHNQQPPIIYRDMKPSNVMLHPDGYVKIIDFGVSREYKDEAKKDTVAFGTQGYAPPEQHGQAQTDARSDIYAVGATMWHLLAGEAPTETPIPDVRTKNPAVGEGFAEVIIPKCTKLDRPLRYQSCEELSADLELYEELTREYRDKQKRKVVSFAVTGILAVVLVLTGFGMLGLRNAAITENHDHHMALAESQKQSNPETARTEYLQSIDYLPADVSAYKGLLDCYRVDGVFDKTEQDEFGAKYRSNLDQLRSSGRFAELSYEIGRLYWTHYEDPTATTYEETREACIKASLEYFRNAVDYADSESNFKTNYYSQAVMYCNIAEFTANISNAVMSGEDNNMYPAYWENLQTLSNELSSTQQSEKDIVDSCTIIAGAMETYMGKFKDIVGVKKTDMDDLYRQVHKQLEDAQTTSDEITSQKNITLERLENKVKPKITTVYAESTSPGTTTKSN